MRCIFILVALLCVSCGTQLPSIKPFRLDIQQGNVVTSKMLLQLRPGMTKSQVRFIMGSPLVQDSFHGNRWDYVYQMHENGRLIEQRRVILDFEKELLKSVRGDVVPAGSELAKVPEAPAPTGTRVVTPVKVEKEKSLLDKLKFWADDAPKVNAVEASKQQGQQNAEPVLPVMAEPVNQTKQDVQQDVKHEAEQTKSGEASSILAVPMVIPDVDDSAQASVVQPTAPASSVPAAELSQSQIEVAPVSVPVSPLAVPEFAEPAAETLAPIMPAPTQPANPYHYQSPAGMQFERKLQIEEEEPPPVIEPSGSRTGNKVAPQPKPLPPETEPSFFDRMLEQIGF
jgi:outer membrane protein assembly factor BamE